MNDIERRSENSVSSGESWFGDYEGGYSSASSDEDSSEYASSDTENESDEEVDLLFESLLEDVRVVPDDNEPIKNFAEEPKALMLTLLVNFAAVEKIPYAKMDRLMKLLVVFFDALRNNGHLSEQSQAIFDGFPTTLKTALSNMKRWHPSDLFRVYAACANNHLTPKEHVLSEGVPQHADARLCKAKERDGQRCHLPILEVKQPERDPPLYKLVRQAPYRGVIRPLAQLLRRQSFVETIIESRTYPPIDPYQCSLSDGERYQKFKDINFVDEVFDHVRSQWLPSAQVPGKPALNLLLIAAIDWCVF